MTRTNKNIINHTFIYTTSELLRRGVSLIMLPIYTRYLTPADYGVVELLSMMIDVGMIIFSARVGSAIFRHYCVAETSIERNRVISSALVLALVMNGIGTIVMLLISDELALIIFSDITYSDYISLFVLTMLLNPFVEIPLVFIRAQQKPWLYFIFSITKLLVQLSLNIYFVVLLELHVQGVIYSAVISAALMAILLTSYTLYKVGLTATLHNTISLFNFGLPLKFAALGSFYMAFGDRYFLNYYTDLTQVGIYSLGYKFGFILLLLAWDPFQKFWDSEKYLIQNKSNAREIYQTVFLYSGIILVFFGLVISIYSKDFISIMADPAFHDAYEIVPIIIIAYIFQAWTKYCNLGILLKKRTIYITYGEIIGVIAITIAYALFIPVYGIHGAAWATVVGFISRFYWTNKLSSQLYDMQLPWKKMTYIVVIACAIYITSLSSPDQLIPSVLFRSALILIFVVLLASLPIMSKEEKKGFFSKYMHPQ